MKLDRYLLAAAALALVALALSPISLLWAASTRPGQQVSSQATPDGYVPSNIDTAARTVASADSADETAHTTPLTGLSGYSSLTLTGHFTASGGTCDLAVVLGHTDGTTFTAKHLETVSLEASSIYTTGTLYLSESRTVDTAASMQAKVLVTAISSGTVTLFAEPH